LTDLFNIKISLNKRVILAEKFIESYLVYIVDLKGEEPIKVDSFKVDNVELSERLEKIGVSKEDVYVILHPIFYYKNNLQLPFTDPQKIAAVIDNEILDYLPNENIPEQSISKGGFISDFDIFNKRIITYSVSEELIRRILKELGEYSDNLKAIIPYGSILRDFISSYCDIKKVTIIECNEIGVEVWGISKDGFGEIAHSIEFEDESGYIDKILSAILSIEKYFQEARYIFLSKVDCKISFKEIAKDYGFRSYKLNYKKIIGNLSEYAIDEYHFLTLYSFINYLKSKKGEKLNLLKGPFKTTLKSYIRVKDFVFVGIFLLILSLFSGGKFFTDMSFHKKSDLQLKNSISSLTGNVFGKKLTSVKSAIKLMDSMKNESEILERNINRKYSALEIFKEFTSALPVDVGLEYTDILIDQNKIRFNGKTKSFSDIDNIKKSLISSDYFTEVKVTNSGTTGSTGGFIVNFQFDIKCKVE